MNDSPIILEQFEGPLALLLELIENSKLDITEVALANVTDQYIAILEAQDELYPDEIADFLLIAARLLYIKSKVFSPDYYLNEPQEESDLARQLRMYQEYVALTKHISARWRSDNYFYSRLKPWRQPQPKFIPPKSISLELLFELMGQQLQALEPIARIQVKKMKTTISIRERIEMIKKIVASKADFNWHDLLQVTKNKTEKIVSFLAVLELVKQREVEVMQEVMFANFIIKKNHKL
jgi:segregation and condensation protein A